MQRTIGTALALLLSVASVPASAQLFGRRAPAEGGAKAQLQAAYPGAFRITGNSVVFGDGTKVVWDDGARKSPAQLLADADVEDMFATPYPRVREGARAPGRDEDPGRVRSETLFRALYGGTEDAVRRSLTRVAWFGGGMTVTTRFGVDRALGRVRDRLKGRSDLAAFLSPPGGGFNWRPIAGTDRLSVHSFGAAVDIATAQTDYWLWAGAPEHGTIPYRNKIPLDIVAAFEAECFIWGGRWYHYDTMHFEYRPELLPGCRRGDE